MFAGVPAGAVESRRDKARGPGRKARRGISVELAAEGEGEKGRSLSVIWYKSRHETEGLHLEELRERRRSSVPLTRVACRFLELLDLVFDKAKRGEN